MKDMHSDYPCDKGNPYDVRNTAGWAMMQMEDRMKRFFKQHDENQKRLKEFLREFECVPPSSSEERGGNIGE